MPFKTPAGRKFTPTSSSSATQAPSVRPLFASQVRKSLVPDIDDDDELDAGLSLSPSGDLKRQKISGRFNALNEHDELDNAVNYGSPRDGEFDEIDDGNLSLPTSSELGDQVNDVLKTPSLPSRFRSTPVQTVSASQSLRHNQCSYPSFQTRLQQASNHASPFQPPRQHHDSVLPDVFSPSRKGNGQQDFLYQGDAYIARSWILGIAARTGLESSRSEHRTAHTIDEVLAGGIDQQYVLVKLRGVKELWMLLHDATRASTRLQCGDRVLIDEATSWSVSAPGCPSHKVSSLWEISS